MRTHNIKLNSFCIKSLLINISTRYFIYCKSVGCSSKIDVYSMITLLNFLNSSPINGFVKKSSNIKFVGQYSTLISPLYILSFINKYLICICMEFPVYELRLFFSIRIALWLSWCITFFSIPQPCALMNIMNHILYGTHLPIPTNSDYVELFMFIFCFEDFPCIISYLIDIAPPVCPLILFCTAYAASIYMYRS